MKTVYKILKNINLKNLALHIAPIYKNVTSQRLNRNAIQYISLQSQYLTMPFSSKRTET